MEKTRGHTNYRNHNVIAARFGNKNDKRNESLDSGIVNSSLPAEFTPFVQIHEHIFGEILSTFAL